jgi:predicted small lipoprotein YifL
MKSSFALLLLACLAACGTKGALYLPQDRPAPAPPAAPAASQPAANQPAANQSPSNTNQQQQNPVK